MNFTYRQSSIVASIYTIYANDEWLEVAWKSSNNKFTKAYLGAGIEFPEFDSIEELAWYIWNELFVSLL